MIFGGIDSGSRTTKLVFLKDDKIIYEDVRVTGISPQATASQMLQEAMEINAVESEPPLIVTGYGRNLIQKKRQRISEISCHARGVYYYFPQVEMIIDIGGQDSKGIMVTPDGTVADFVMNDRCAAGTGRFLEKAAGILEVDISQLGWLALKAEEQLSINSTCVVFAESEMIGLIAKAIPPASIAWAVHRSIAQRTVNMISGFSAAKFIAFTGGVALNPAMIKALEIELRSEMMIPPNPCITGALGAALFAREQHEN
jgi:predicted CoA-substrate-specific enzyme activase